MPRRASRQVPWIGTGHAALTHACFIENGEQLWVAYKSGNVYRFVGIPRKWYDGLMTAENPAKFVQDHLADKFDSRRLHGFAPPPTSIRGD